MNAQEILIGHLLPIAATVAVFWLVYRLLFRNSNRLQFNRFFLLTSLLLALAMPLLGLLSGLQVPQMATLKQNLFNGTMLKEVIVTADGQPVLPEMTVTTSDAPSRFSVWQVIGGVYLIGVGVMTLLFLFKLGRILVLIIRSPKRKIEGCTAVFTGREQGSFSFFRYAFFPHENVDPDIMRHEMSHIAHHHSWDILFAELMMILQWFNPFIYRYKKELQSLHEYQADRDVVATGIDKKNYMMLILQQCTAVDFSGMSNNFSLILTKKRIKMITKNEKAKGLWWRLLATLPVLAILLIANSKVAAQEQQSDNDVINVEIGRIEIYDDNGLPMNLSDTAIYNEDGSFIRFETTEATDPISGEMRNKTTVTFHSADGTPNENLQFHLNTMERHGDTTMYGIDSPINISSGAFKLRIVTTEENPVQVLNTDNDTVFQIVEQMPQFPGGEQALMEFVAKSVVYPEEAKEKNISGRVFVSFVVEKDGSVSNVKVLRGIGGGCDEEAVRVIKSMPKWEPGKMKGKPVRVSYQIPFNFKLDNTLTPPARQSEVGRANMKPDENGVYQIVEEMPHYPGGETAMMEYVAQNIVYPQEARDKEISGRVFVGFVVEKDGSIGEIKLLRGIGGGCDEEAVRVIKSMPKWEPGKMHGEPVRVSYQMPINFKMQ